MSAEEVVNKFMGSFNTKDLETAMSLVSEDVYYDNVPVGDMRGKDAVREFLSPMMHGPGDVEFEIHRQVASDNIVFNERTDRMVMKGKAIAIPETGVFEVNDEGLITFWRDYFDNGTFMKQLKG